MIKRAEIALRLGLTGSTPDVVMYLYDVMRASIKNGKRDERGYYVHVGEKKIAAQIGKSPRTVARAIKQLIDLGLIERKDKRGNSRTYFRGRLAAEVISLSGTTAPISKSKRSTQNKSTIENEASDTVDADVNGTSNDASLSSPSIKDTSIKNNNNNQSIMIEDNENNSLGSESASVRTKHIKSASYKSKEQSAKQAKQYIEQLKRKIETQLHARDEDFGEYAIIDAESQHSALKSISTLLAETVAGDRSIRVNGLEVRPFDYWQRIKNITREAVMDIIDRVEQCLDYVTNKRAYLLAALYNGAIEQPMYDI